MASSRQEFPDAEEPFVEQMIEALAFLRWSKEYKQADNDMDPRIVQFAQDCYARALSNMTAYLRAHAL